MPPRYAYWTILIDDKPTAFRAREREELQPTLVQLQRKNTNVTMQWFARGRLWASREAERDDFQMYKHAAAAPRDHRTDRPEGTERRGSEWRPGGAHKDPRDRFKKKNRPERAWSEKDPATQRDRDKPGYVARERKPWADKPAGPPRGDRPWSNKPPGGDRPPGHRSSSDSRPSGGGLSGKPPDRSGPPRPRKPWDKAAASAPPSDRPWQTKPTGPRAQRKPWIPKAAGDAPRGDRPPGHRSSSDSRPSGGGWSNKPAGAPPRGDRPWRDKPAGGPPLGDRPWSNKPPGGPPRGDRPWSSKPPSGPPRGDRPWSGKPRDQDRKPFTPRGPRPERDGPPRKRRNDDD